MSTYPARWGNRWINRARWTTVRRAGRFTIMIVSVQISVTPRIVGTFALLVI
jgi:hypothetical protein